MATTGTTKAAYAADSIVALEGLEPVRTRPGMYIGSTGPRGLHHLIWEVVDNSVDEAMAGHADRIIVTLTDDHDEINETPVDTVTVIDNGRGIPVDEHKSGVSALEVVLTKLHAGGKFNNDAYAVSGGLHGVGISVVNALSVDLVATVRRDGFEHQLSFRNTIPGTLFRNSATKKTGTTIAFTPDPVIFTDAIDDESARLAFDYETIADRLNTIAFLNPRLTIELTDKRSHTPARSDTWHHPGGVTDYVRSITKPPAHPNVIPVIGTKDGIEVEGALQWAKSHTSVLKTYVNTIDTVEGGTHEQGFRAALTMAINQRTKLQLTGNDVQDGLRAVVAVKHPSPQFEGQTKTKLGNAPAKGVVQSISYDAIVSWLDAHPNEAKAIVANASMAAEAREAATKAKEKVQKKTGLQLGSEPGKLAGCRSRTPKDCEIYIVEGDSAGGSAKTGRDSKTQAILPLRGKVINAHRVKQVDVLRNKEVGTLITALQCGIGAECDPAKLRYDKVVVMADADIDGSHIATLLMTFLWEYMRPIIETGHVYLAKPPLFKLKWNKGKHQYAYDDAERDKLLTQGRKQGRKLPADGGIQRFKGLGEMNASELWETTMNPETRTLQRISTGRIEQIDELVDLLMGDQPAPRFRHIMANTAAAAAASGD